MTTQNSQLEIAAIVGEIEMPITVEQNEIQFTYMNLYTGYANC